MTASSISQHSANQCSRDRKDVAHSRQGEPCVHTLPDTFHNQTQDSSATPVPDYGVLTAASRGLQLPFTNGES